MQVNIIYITICFTLRNFKNRRTVRHFKIKIMRQNVRKSSKNREIKFFCLVALGVSRVGRQLPCAGRQLWGVERQFMGVECLLTLPWPSDLVIYLYCVCSKDSCVNSFAIFIIFHDLCSLFLKFCFNDTTSLCFINVRLRFRSRGTGVKSILLI